MALSRPKNWPASEFGYLEGSERLGRPGPRIKVERAEGVSPLPPTLSSNPRPYLDELSLQRLAPLPFGYSPDLPAAGTVDEEAPTLRATFYPVEGSVLAARTDVGSFVVCGSVVIDFDVGGAVIGDTVPTDAVLTVVPS